MYLKPYCHFFYISDTVLSMGYVEQLAIILGNEDTDNISREHCTAAVYGLASSYPQALQDALRPELGLPQLLRSRLSTISGKEEFQVSCFEVKLQKIIVFQLAA